MSDEKTDDVFSHVPIEPPAPEDEDMEEAGIDLPGGGDDDGGVPPGTQERIRDEIAEAQRRRDRAEMKDGK